MISIFKTNVASSKEAEIISPYLNKLLERLNWTIDLSDCDRILRVDSPDDKNDEVIRVLNHNGFLCIELATFYAAPV
ncbi:hypothetical protein LPB86_10065 [Pedobacter sp. MC2016-14]|uniref:hypothetical protein n=1 Tax=Pedobacter sp. MC2016-14 TaxID=2897327 RepID=UPI001E2C972A|nr:hypothetical protein [Pedobacter sp. MC2016-14]MCD0488577.1 hypothetical protein [Pedobacter sp. MC2016-14]